MPFVTRFHSSPRRLAALVPLVATACESPAAPVPCGPLPEVTVNVGETSDVTACFNDADSDVLNYTVASASPAVAEASISGTAASVTGVAPGNTTITVTATDPGGLEGRQDFAVIVPNRAPQPRGTVPSVTVEVDATATVDASQYFSEPDGEALAYGADASDTAVARVSVAGATITVTVEARGVTNVTITASDPGGLSATQTFMVTVPNRAPQAVGAIDAQTMEIARSLLVELASAFTDPDGDTLTYTAAASDSSLLSATVSGDGRLLLLGWDLGTTTVTATARDPGGLTATQSFMVTVAPALTRLTFHSATDASPDWSRDSILYDSDRDGNHEIYVMNEDGRGGWKRLTNDTATDAAPAWSPDGTRVAFHSDRDGNDEIYVMDADGSDLERLTNHGSGDREPAWSPDGTRIAFRSDRDGNDEIYVMDADGSGVTRLTNNGATDRSPAWAPDGIRIAFISNRDGNHEIYAMQISFWPNAGR